MVCLYIWYIGLKGKRCLSPNTTISENVSYDTIGHTVRMSAQADLTCSENISYATLEKVHNDTDGSTVATSHTAVYDEVAPKK